MSNQLLPCPFCGHDEPTHDEGDQSAWVQCTNFECGMCGPIASGPSLAAAAWNRRAIQPAAGEPIHQWADQDLWMDGDEADMASARAEGFKTRTLWTAPPTAAHGDEAVRKDAERYRWLKDWLDDSPQSIYLLPSNEGDLMDEAIDAAMRAQGDDRLLFTDAIMPGGLTET